MSKKNPSFSYLDSTHIVNPSRNPVSNTGRLKNKTIKRKKYGRFRFSWSEILNSVPKYLLLLRDNIFPSAFQLKLIFTRIKVDGTAMPRRLLACVRCFIRKQTYRPVRLIISCKKINKLIWQTKPLRKRISWRTVCFKFFLGYALVLMLDFCGSPQSSIISSCRKTLMWRNTPVKFCKDLSCPNNWPN